jgi:hypothetical protein
MLEKSKNREDSKGNRLMTTPTVTELPRRREPVARDTFLGDLALGEQRLYGDVRIALTALGLHPAASPAETDACGSALGLLHDGYC